MKSKGTTVPTGHGGSEEAPATINRVADRHSSSDESDGALDRGGKKNRNATSGKPEEILMLKERDTKNQKKTEQVIGR
jgi:hypothetical protein